MATRKKFQSSQSKKLFEGFTLLPGVKKPKTIIKSDPKNGRFGFTDESKKYLQVAMAGLMFGSVGIWFAQNTNYGSTAKKSSVSSSRYSDKQKTRTTTTDDKRQRTKNNGGTTTAKTIHQRTKTTTQSKESKPKKTPTNTGEFKKTPEPKNKQAKPSSSSSRAKPIEQVKLPCETPDELYHKAQETLRGAASKLSEIAPEGDLATVASFIAEDGSQLGQKLADEIYKSQNCNELEANLDSYKDNVFWSELQGSCPNVSDWGLVRTSGEINGFFFNTLTHDIEELLI